MFGVVKRDDKDAESDLVVDVFFDLVLFVVVLFLLVKGGCISEIFLLWAVIVVVMIEDDVTVYVDVVGDLHETDSSIKCLFRDSS
jgi:hypothetical protein